MGLCVKCTFAQAKTNLMEHLRSHGWKMSGALKVPHATSPCGRLRLWFKPQAIWYTYGENNHSMSAARSTHDDVRSLSPAEFVQRQWDFVNRHFA